MCPSGMSLRDANTRCSTICTCKPHLRTYLGSVATTNWKGRASHTQFITQMAWCYHKVLCPVEIYYSHDVVLGRHKTRCFHVEKYVPRLFSGWPFVGIDRPNEGGGGGSYNNRKITLLCNYSSCAHFLTTVMSLWLYHDNRKIHGLLRKRYPFRPTLTAVEASRLPTPPPGRPAS